MKKQILFFFCLLFVFSTAQDYHWDGEWKIWDIIPGTHIGRCCKPSSLKITKDTKNSSILHFFMKIPPQPECPKFDNVLTFTENVHMGRFHDQNPNSTIRGIKGEFHPNNNTILISPGPLGTCKWVLGSSISIMTNTTDSNLAMNWEGPWIIGSMYKQVPNANCCVPLTPIITKEDQKTLTISYNAFYPDQPECSSAMKNATITFNATVRWGMFDTHHGTRGYYLPNSTVQTERDGCVMLWEKWTPSGPHMMASALLTNRVKVANVEAEELELEEEMKAVDIQEKMKGLTNDMFFEYI